VVVVAIIAVLVAVSIPIFTAKLEKSREATDIANMRAAKAAATVELLDNVTAANVAPTTDSVTEYYDTEAGKMTATMPTTYGKGTSKNGGMTYSGYTNTEAYTSKVISATINYKEDTVTIGWAAKSGN